MHIHHVIPIEVRHLFPILDEKLISLLQSLTEEQWHKQTIAPLWDVKDIAAHLLDGNIRSLSIARDKFYGDKPGDIASYGELVGYLDRLNADWVKAYKRVSPQILIAQLQQTGKEYTDFLMTQDMWADAVFPVAWAGEETSANWFHIAREYTEKWIHQQQIRDAVGRYEDGIIDLEFFHPFIATFMCALPYTYRDMNVSTGTSVCVVVDGIDDEWHINKTDEGWVLRKETRLQPDARVTMDKDTAWRLFSKGLTPAEALAKVRIEGNEELGKNALNMVSVMA